jgi:hypothetical protein
MAAFTQSMNGATWPGWLGSKQRGIHRPGGRMPPGNGTIRKWHRLSRLDGVKGPAGFSHGGRAGPLPLDQQAMLIELGRPR